MDYADPGRRFSLAAGQEVDRFFSATSSNTEIRHFFYRQYRARPGIHHIVVNTGGALNDGIEAGGRRLGFAQHVESDVPEGGVVAPENERVGMAIAPGTSISVNLHHINTTDEPIIQEAWINFWYVDEPTVEQEVRDLFSFGSVTFEVSPGQDTVLGPYSCEALDSGRLLSLSGHRHASNVRFSAWHRRGAQRTLIYEDYDWREPLELFYDSITTNRAPDPTARHGGGASGVIDLMPGDRLEWECHVINRTDGTLLFVNEALTGEMCVLTGNTVGTDCSGQVL